MNAIKFFVTGFIVLSLFSACTTQKKITVQYLGQRYAPTQNKSFLNNTLILLKGNDTVLMNVKLPFDAAAADTINNGILFRCFLKEKQVYTIKLRAIRVDAIPDAVNSYYKINAIFSKKRTRKFTEVKRDTEFLYRNPGKYVDINHRVYELLEIWPDKDCAFE